eukprot:2090337-Prymnesium_polylepis.1
MICRPSPCAPSRPLPSAAPARSLACYLTARRQRDSPNELPRAGRLPNMAGFRIEAPRGAVDSFQEGLHFTTAVFGPPLPERPLSRCVVVASPPHACTPLINAHAVSGCFALIDRGPADASACPFPGRYFANKVKAAQDANAVGVIMVNNLDTGLVHMGAVSGDHAAQVAT